MFHCYLRSAESSGSGQPSRWARFAVGVAATAALTAVLVVPAAPALASEKPAQITAQAVTPAKPAMVQATGQQQTAAQPAGPRPKFRCDELVHDFGEAWALSKIEHTFIIHNDGDGELTLEARPTCGCQVADYDKTVPPKGQGKIKIVLTTPNSTAPTNKPLNVTTNDPDKPKVVLSMKGNVKQKVSSEPYLTAYFGQLAPDIDLTRKFKLTNNMEEPMKIEVVPPTTPTCFKVSVEEIEPGKVAELTVTAEPPFKEGTNTARFTIKTGMKDTPNLSLPCNLIKPPTVQVAPPILRVPASGTGATYRQAVTVRNNGDEPFQVLSAKSSDERIKLQVKEITPNKLWTIVVQIDSGFTMAPGEQPVLTITTDYEPKPVHTVRLIPATPPRRPSPTPSAARTPPTPPTITTAESLIGRAAPAMPIQSTDGRQFRIGPGSKQVMLVNFWASWCTPSRTQLPLLDQLYRGHRIKGVEFINVIVDRYRPAEEIAEELGAAGSRFPVVADPGHRLVKAYGISDVPTTLLIGRNGVVEAVQRGIGRNEKELEVISEMLTDRLGKLVDGKTRAEFKPYPVFAGSTCRLQQMPVSAASDATGAVLAVEAFRQDAGLFNPKTRGEHKLFLRNTGGEPLEIKDVRPSPGLAIEPSYPKTLPPGSTGFVVCRFETPSAPEAFHHQVTIESNATSPVLNVIIQGRSRPYFEVDPPSGVDFSDNPRLFNAPRLVTVKYNGDGEVDYKEPKSSSPKFEAELQPIRHPSARMIVVRALPPFEPGPVSETIKVETNHPEQPVVEIPVKLHMPRRLEIQPSEINLPATGALHREQVRIVNSGDPISVLSVAASKPNIQTQFFPEPDGASYRLQITIPPNFIGSSEGESITIRTDDEEFGEIVIPIRVTGNTGARRPGPSAPIVKPQN